jgi:Putative phage metallopeptidase
MAKPTQDKETELAYSIADDSVETVLEDILHEYPEMQWLANFNPVFLYAHKDKAKAGRRVLGTTKLFSDKDYLLHDYDYMVTICRTFWFAYPEKRKALLYHELCHLFFDEEINKLTLVGHDIEEFNAVIKRFGDWNREIEPLKNAYDVYQQLRLELAYSEDNKNAKV